MSRRVKLHIDKHVHLNDVTFQVYRTKSATEDITNKLVMLVHEPTAIKTTYTEDAEKLVRDAHTPYAFYVARHFDEVPLPKLVVGNTDVEDRDLMMFSDEKMVEIHNGDLGLSDGRSVYMTYNYQAMDVMDDYGIQSGVTYYGPPATGLQLPINLTITQDLANGKIVVKYEANTLPVVYFYRIKAVDTDGNVSPISQTMSVEVEPDSSDIFYRIEKSPNGEQWNPVSFSNMLEWHDVIEVLERPANVANLMVTPLGSKQAEVRFDNPWYWWETYPRTSFRYRIRVEDMVGEHSDWLYLDPIEIHLKPTEVLIRRKRDNGATSSYDGIDAIDVWRLTEDKVRVTDPTILLIDDQLNDATKYGYTVFYTDELKMQANALYAVSDHTPWANIILFKGHFASDNIINDNFMISFELADRIIEIGTTP